MDNNIFAVVDEKKNKTVQKIKTGVQKYLIFFVLLFNIILSVVSRLYKFDLQNPFSVEFFLELSISVFTAMICYVCFVPFGRSEEMRRTVDFHKTISSWQNLSQIVRAGYLKLFGIFCDERVCDERNEAKKLIIENNTVIPFDYYKKEYENLSKNQLKELLKNEKISKKEYKAIIRANGYGLFNPTKIRNINPVIILSGAKKSSVNDAGRTDKSYIARWLTERPLVMFVTTAILNSIVTTFSGGGENVLLDMLIAIFQIVIAAICGYSAGASDFRYNLDRINSRIIFISLFCEKNNIKIK
ncbi:MAG: hypothetical protein E7017_07795 [Alphaproteobacteria bacterium]|nr:hypothetical protein [Alphaproteobacteria bacterium]